MSRWAHAGRLRYACCARRRAAALRPRGATGRQHLGCVHGAVMSPGCARRHDYCDPLGAAAAAHHRGPALARHDDARGALLSERARTADRVETERRVALLKKNEVFAAIETACPPRHRMFERARSTRARRCARPATKRAEVYVCQRTGGRAQPQKRLDARHGRPGSGDGGVRPASPHARRTATLYAITRTEVLTSTIRALPAIRPRVPACALAMLGVTVECLQREKTRYRANLGQSPN